MAESIKLKGEGNAPAMARISIVFSFTASIVAEPLLVIFKTPTIFKALEIGYVDTRLMQAT